MEHRTKHTCILVDDKQAYNVSLVERNYIKLWPWRQDLPGYRVANLRGPRSTKPRACSHQRTSRPNQSCVFTFQRASKPTIARAFAIPIPIASNAHDRTCDRSCDRSRSRSLQLGSSKHKNNIAIKLRYSLWMYMHRSTLA